MSMQNKLTYKWNPSSSLWGVYVFGGESEEDFYENAPIPVPAYIDVFKDLTRAGRKNYPHTNNEGELQVADVRITIHTDQVPDSTLGFEEGIFQIYHAPLSWTVRNGVKMAQQIRKNQLRSIGKPLRKLSPYNRALTLWLDGSHVSELTPQYYLPVASTGGAVQMTDYSALVADQYERTKLLSADDTSGFELQISGTHSGAFPNWSRISCSQAYHEARVKIPDELPVVNDDDIVVDSPFMSLQETTSTVDGLTSEMITQLKEERDEVPYDTTLDGDHTHLVNGGIMKMGGGLPWSTSTRCQLPGGLGKLTGLIANSYELLGVASTPRIHEGTVTVEVELLGIYTM